MDLRTLKVTLTMDGKQFVLTAEEGRGVMKKLEEQLGKTEVAVRKVEGSLQSGIRGFGEFVRTLGLARFALLDIYDVFIRLPMSILKNTGELERMTQVMFGLSKASTDVGRQMEAMAGKNFVLEMAKSAPFALKSIQDAFIKFKSGGIDPTNGSLKALVDSVAKFGGTNESLVRASVAIQQMAGKGVISMEELRQQLGEAVPDAMRMMATGIGVSMETLVARISKGEVGAKEALRRMFFVMRMENDGAAAMMMKTWSGMVSQLSTVWLEVQESIGKSGFAQAAKEALSGIIDYLKDPETRAFASSFGAGLGEAVLRVTELVKWLAQFSEVAKVAGIALVSFFAVSRITGMASNIAMSIQNVTNAYRESAAESLRANTQARVAEIERNNIAITASNQRIAIMQREQMAARLEAEKMIAIQMRQAAAAAALDAKFQTPAAAKSLSIDAREIEAAAVMSQRYRDASLAAGAMAAAQEQKVAALGRSIAATNAANAAIAANTTALSTNAVAANTAAGAMGALRAVWAAMGGWIGALTIAITAGYFAWEKWGNAGEKAIQKIREELSRGFVTKEAAAGLDKVVLDKENQLSELQGRLERVKALSTVPGTSADERKQKTIALLEAEAEGLRQEIKALNGDQVAAFKKLRRQDADEDVSKLRSRLDEELNSVTQNFRALATARNAAKEKELQEQKLSADERKKIEEKNSAELKGIWASEAAAKVELLKRAKANLEKSLGANAVSVSGKAQLDEINKRIIDAQGLANEANSIRDNKFEFQAPKNAPNDPLNDLLKEAKGRMEEARIRVADLDDGVVQFDNIWKGILARLEGRRNAGDFDVKGEDGKKSRPSSDDLRLEQVAKAMAQAEASAKGQSALMNIIRQRASVQEALDESNDRLANSDGKLDTAFLRLERQLARVRVGMVDMGNETNMVKGQFDKFSEQVRESQAKIGNNDYIIGLITSTKNIQASLSDDTLARAEDQFQRANEIERQKLAYRINLLRDTVVYEKDYNEQVAKTTEAYYKNAEARAAEHAKKMRTPVQQLATDWLNLSQQLNQATGKWMNDITESLVEFGRTGKFEFKKLVDGILVDLLRINIRKGIAEPLSNMLTGAKDFLQKGMSGQNAKEGNGIPNPLDGLKGIWDKLTGATKKVEDGFNDLSAKGIEEMFQSTAKVVVQDGVKSSATVTATSELYQFAMALQVASQTAAGFGAGGANVMMPGMGGFSGILSAFEPFANGGIMTSSGKLPFNAYSSGGIARGPQLAMFGEGRMPEAYVPLPDGNRIPVDMRGSSGDAVQININIDNSGKADQRGGDGSEFARTLSNKIRGVVQEEMLKQRRAGGA